MFVRIAPILSFLITLGLLNSLTLAQVQYYGVDSSVDDNSLVSVNMTITFSKPETAFNFTLLGKIDNLKYGTLGNSMNCTLESAGYSTILCDINLTEQRRSIDISFDTKDLIKPLDSRFLYNGDFSINRNIDRTYFSVKLPEGMGLVNDTSSAIRLSFPSNTTILSDGRRIIVIWNLQNIDSSTQLRFQLLYERISDVLPTLFRLRYVAIIVTAAAAGLGFVWFRYLREPQRLVLSVLDQYERRVMDVLVANNGSVDQRRIVEQTNLSKAKVSRVVKSLTERGLVEIERHGRSNKIKMVKKKFRL